MTQVFWRFPEVEARDTKSAKAGRGRPERKYDHWQMLQDRIAGMSWGEIEAKHEIPQRGCWRGGAAWRIALTSSAIKKLAPHEVALLRSRAA